MEPSRRVILLLVSGGFAVLLIAACITGFFPHRKRGECPLTLMLLGLVLSQTADVCDDPDPYSYFIVMDAGSTKTLLQVYRWMPGETILGSPVLERVGASSISRPGIAEFVGREQELFPYFWKLMTYAQALVPQQKRPLTPLHLKATAGLRLLNSTEKQQGVLDVVRSVFSTSSFMFRSPWATMLDGRDEALFGWIAANYDPSAYAIARDPLHPTLGMIDVGGSSVELSFVPTDQAPSHDKISLNMANVNYHVHVASYDGFGFDQFRYQVEDHFIKEQYVAIWVVLFEVVDD